MLLPHLFGFISSQQIERLQVCPQQFQSIIISIYSILFLRNILKGQVVGRNIDRLKVKLFCRKCAGLNVFDENSSGWFVPKKFPSLFFVQCSTNYSMASKPDFLQSFFTSHSLFYANIERHGNSLDELSEAYCNSPWDFGNDLFFKFSFRVTDLWQPQDTSFADCVFQTWHQVRPKITAQSLLCLYI